MALPPAVLRCVVKLVESGLIPGQEKMHFGRMFFVQRDAHIEEGAVIRFNGSHVRFTFFNAFLQRTIGMHLVETSRLETWHASAFPTLIKFFSESLVVPDNLVLAVNNHHR